MNRFLAKTSRNGQKPVKTKLVKNLKFGFKLQIKSTIKNSSDLKKSSVLRLFSQVGNCVQNLDLNIESY